MTSVAITWTLYAYLGFFHIGPALLADLPSKAACEARHRANAAGTVCLPGLSGPPQLNPIRAGRVYEVKDPKR
jgi:hypothetical protein